jgi:CheY-like chemotaxis protein
MDGISGFAICCRRNTRLFTDAWYFGVSMEPALYDLVLIDIKMPKIDGFVLYELLKTVDPGVKVCFLTASEMYREEVREVEHCALNKDLFLQKPISTSHKLQLKV